MFESNWGRFFRDYPDGYFISLIRHPGSWFASARRHNPKEYSSLDDAIALWGGSVESSLKLKEEFGERVILILFEDLITDTKSIMKKVCEITGILWHEGLTVPTFGSSPNRVGRLLYV